MRTQKNPATSALPCRIIPNSRARASHSIFPSDLNVVESGHFAPPQTNCTSSVLTGIHGQPLERRPNSQEKKQGLKLGDFSNSGEDARQARDCNLRGVDFRLKELTV